MKANEAESLLNESQGQMKKFHEIVKTTMEEQKLIINNLMNPPKEILTRGQSISDKVARFGGSWKFIILFSLILAVWIIFNILSPVNDRFDPYPFILMNLVLSCIAAMQAPIIMMSQNRQEEKDRLRGENDYLINLKAEIEIRSLHNKMDLLLEEQIRTLFDSQSRQLGLLLDISKKLGTMPGNDQ